MYLNSKIYIMGIVLGIIAGISFQNSEMITSFALPENFTLSDAKLKKSDTVLNADMKSDRKITQNGTQGAMGVAVITDKGFDAVIASTTHGGIYDSVQQKNASDPSWHNHFVKLVADNSSKCGSNPMVKDLTLQSPGNVMIADNNIRMLEIPSNFNASSSLSNSTLSFETGRNIDKVVTFKLEPIFDSTNNVEAICVKDIKPAANLYIE